MSTSKKSVKIVQKLIRQILQLSRTITKKLMSFLLRSLLVFGRRSRLSRAGFVLPTVVMVMLVVVLLTSAVVFRSFDRSRNISNYRVNQEVLNAALPALDRAKAKIEALFADPNLPRGTPSDIPIDSVLKSNTYNLPDEERLRLRYDLPGGTQNANREDDPTLRIEDEAITTHAWRFPVDSDNNGKNDSFTLYSILFRTPNANAAGEFNRERVPLEARALPMTNGESSPNCALASGTSASLVGASGWYKTGSQLKRSFFIYVTTVPITDKDSLGLDDPENYENYTGNKGFSALEYQQDRAKFPLSNNAVLYEDDLDISSGGELTLNGRIFTNSNLFIKQINTSKPITLRQVSSRNSCFYEPENSKIVVGGNVAYGRVTDAATDPTTGNIGVHLYQGDRTTNDPYLVPTLSSANQSVEQKPSAVAYNSRAYEARIAKLVELGIANNPDPSEVTDAVNTQLNSPNPPTADDARRKEIESYFRNRTRRVPFTEVAFGTDEDLSSVALTGSGDTLGPPREWIYPFDPDDGKTASGYGQLTLNTSGNKLLPPTTRFETQEQTGKEELIGDRVLIGNNLPARWLKGNTWVGEDEKQDIQGTVWDNPDLGPRARKTRVEVLSDLGDISRDGFWERKAAELPENSLDGIGGVRIVTGAGIYLPDDNAINAASRVVWPDTMPVIPSDVPLDPLDPRISWLTDFPQDVTGIKRPFLKMRATAVYAYNHEQGKKPIACVSSFYDPTNAQTVENRIDIGGGVAPGANSVNGITYGPPTTTEGAVLDYLNYEADLVYPNGRPVNALLKTALGTAPDARTLAQQAAIDATICGLQIYGKTVRTGADGTWGDIGEPTETPTAGYQLPHLTIKEVAFLDGRQIKAITGQLEDEDSDATTPETTNYTPSTAYDLALEQRQPLEIRVTQLNLQNLRTSTAGELITSTGVTGPQEHMLPLSGIIYATRDDALADASDTDAVDTTNDKVAASDFLLDFKRRPNGIMLINGGRLERTHTFVEQEKGLILASNLPVYVKAEPRVPGDSLGGFNSHQNLSGQPQEEFNDTTANFYAREDANPFFACRAGDPRLSSCTQSDTWRPATILSDAVTLLSSTFREGNRAEGDYDLRNNQIDIIADTDTNGTADADGDGTDDLKAASEIEKARLKNGFWNNDFVTNGLSSEGITVDGRTPKDADYINTTASTTYVGSSYFNNFVTPVQRRVRFPEYVMEICRKLPVSECTADDWVVGYNFDGNTELSPTERIIKSSELAAAFQAQSLNPFTQPDDLEAALLGAGTTTRPAMLPEDRRYARRVAFLRYPATVTDLTVTTTSGEVNTTSAVAGALVLHRTTAAAPWTPVPLGIAGLDASDTNVTLRYYPYSTTLKIHWPILGGSTGIDYFSYSGSGVARRPRLRANTLWYRAQNGTNKDYSFLYPLAYVNGSDTPALGGTAPDEQPLLVPVLQLHVTQTPTSFPPSLPSFPGTPTVGSTRWIQQADADTIFNLVMGTGDSPSRPSSGVGDQGEFNGGLSNLPRFLENWIKTASTDTRFLSKINGSLIQIKRSSYATAPFQQVPISFTGSYPSSLPLGGLFDYPQGYNTGNSAGRTPAYEAPGREWGFDVGVLSQLPDLFSKQFTVPLTEKPNEFFREVGRDDDWIETLLCAKTPDNSIAINADQRPSGFCNQHTGG